MIERLRTRAQHLTPAAQASTLTLIAGLVFLLAGTGGTPLLPLASIAAGLIGFGLSRTRSRVSAEPAAFALLGVVNTCTLSLLPLLIHPVGAWWMAAVLLALFSLFLARHNLSARAFAFLNLAYLAGALVGAAVLIADSHPEFDTALLGLGSLIFGQIAAALLPPQMPQAMPRTTPFALDLNHMVMQLHVTSDGLVRAVDAMNQIGEMQLDGANEQVELITRTNELLSDFLELSGGIREQARSIAAMAQQAAELSQNGQTAVQQAIEGMEEIRRQVSAIAGTILALAQFTQRIDEIITSVSEIATQSNLLALNASIEAARAGAHGRGFAVVADEVRSLSQQSTQAAKQVRAILGEIQTAMKETIRATEVGMQGVDAGAAMTQQADTIMVQLAQNVNASHEAVRHIYEVILEQVNGLEEIAISIERIDRITQQNLTSTSTVRTVSTELTRLAADLQATVGMSDQAGLVPVNQNTQDYSEEHAGQPQPDAEEHRAAEQPAT